MPGGNKGLGNVTNGLLHYGARYYDPTTGRWTQPDSLNQAFSPIQADRFLFAGSGPVNLSDPRGREVTEEAGEWLGEGAGQAAITVADAGFKAFGAFAAAAVCVDTGGVGCLAAGESYLLADKLAGESVFKESCLEE